MRTKVLEIRWHETSPIFSADYQSLSPAHLKRLLHPKGKDGDEPGPSVSAAPSASSKDASGHLIAQGRSYRLATAGADNHVRLWLIHPNIVEPSSASAASSSSGPPPAPRAEFLATLKRHTAAVNVVRWSPKDDLLASAGDDGHVVLWVPKPISADAAVASSSSFNAFSEFPGNDEGAKENWKVKTVVRVTSNEIYDLAWSPDGSYFIVGSTDNTAKIYDASTGTCIKIIAEHSHYVQGVAWDPLNEFIATQSSDRTVHIHRIVQTKGTLDFVPLSRSTKMDIHHSRSPSFSSISSSSAALSLSRPGWGRRSSAALSDTESASGMSELPSGDAAALAAVWGGAGSNQGPLTPTASLPGTPSLAPSERERERESGSMKPPSRRSSFTSSAAASPPPPSLPASFPALNAVATSSARGRSPSPLPAFRPRARSNALYGDEAFTHYFRRLSFSPDGALLLTPAGQIEDSLLNFPASPSLDGSFAPPPPPSASASSSSNGTRPTVYIYGRANLHGAPIAHLPGQKSASVAVKFSPILYELRTVGTEAGKPVVVVVDEKKGDVVDVKLGGATAAPTGAEKDKEIGQDMSVVTDAPSAPPSTASTSASASSTHLAPSPSPVHATASSSSSSSSVPASPHPPSVFALAYRMYYAVATQDAVLLYDTQQVGPIAIFHGLHYAGFTDLAWSPDGQSLILSSVDGYCSVVVFDPSELGVLSPTQQHQKQLAALAQHLSAPASLAPPPLPAPALPASPSLASATPEASGSAEKRAAPSPVPGIGSAGEEGKEATVEGAAKKKRRVAPTQIGTLD